MFDWTDTLKLFLICLVFCTGLAMGMNVGENKTKQLLLEQKEQYELAQDDIINRKDATINLLIKEYNSLNSSSVDNRKLIDRLQYNLSESNKRLRDSEGACNKRLADCQELLSRGTELLGRCSELYTNTAVKKDAVINLISGQ